ncbi:MAG: hypothetical protein JJU13_01525 [Balneolaceae bacterium]|nr:hypothetical protein [Balneolaceae bacterium]
MNQESTIQMRKKLISLAKKAGALQPDSQERLRLEAMATEYAERFFDSLPHQKAYSAFDTKDFNFKNDTIPEEGQSPSQLFKDVENRVVRPGLNTVSGRHFGYIPGGGLASSAIGDYLAAVTNRYAGVYSISPGAVSLETRLVNWMCGLMGYGASSGGYLASGGSIANFTAIVTARDTAGLKAADYSKAVVYLTRQTHHCVDRALNMAGLRECARRYIIMDDQFRMKSDELETAIRQDRKNGLIPWLIVGSAGSTDTGVC